jgi:hypothetical protein
MFKAMFRSTGFYALLAIVLILVGCRSLSPIAVPVVQPPDQIIPTRTPLFLPGTSQPLKAGDQTKALLPAFQQDMASLHNLTRYEITLDIDYPDRTISGHEQVVYTNTETIPLDRLYFRLLPNGHQSYGNGSLSVSRVELNSQSVQTSLSLSDSVVEVKPDRELAVGEVARLDIDFSGVVPRDFGGTATPAGYGIYNVSDGVMTLSGWYPILAVYDNQGWNLDPVSPIGDSVYSEMAYYSIKVTAASSLILASTGVEIGRSTEDQTTLHYLISGPARDFTLVLSPDFQVASRIIEGTQVNAYYLSDHSVGGDTALSVAADSLEIYGHHFGQYPYTELDIVDVPMRNASGVEYPGLVLIGDTLYDQPASTSFTVAVAHEVAHQWWYNLVGNNVFQDPWLDEALTSYTSALYEQEALGESAYQGLVGYWQDRYDQVLQIDKDDLVTENLSHFESLRDPRVYSWVVYSKGALFFKEVRDRIGDKAFFEALRNYYQQEKYRVARPEDLLQAFNQAAGKSLDDLYQIWLYSANK